MLKCPHCRRGFPEFMFKRDTDGRAEYSCHNCHQTFDICWAAHVASWKNDEPETTENNA